MKSAEEDRSGRTPREPASEDLRLSEPALSTAFHSNAAAMLMTRLADGLVLDANDAWLSLTGLRRDEVVGKRAAELGVWRDLRDRERMIREVEKAGLVRNIEIVCVRRSGEEYTVLLSAQAVQMRGESVLLSSAIDISERKRAEEALAQSEERFRSVLSNSVDVIYRLNVVTGRFEYISPAAERVVGFSPDEMMGQTAETALDMVHPEDRPAMRAALSRLDESSEIEVEYRQRTKSGDYVWISNHISLIRDAAGRPLSRIGNIRDISRRKRAEEELERSNRKLTDVLKSIQDDFYVLDRNWIFVFANRQFAAKIGKEPADFLGRSIWEMFPKHLGTVFEENLRAAMEKREIRRFEVGGKYTDAWYSMTAFPSPEGITVLGTDISERRRAEEALRASESRLRTVLDATQESIWMFGPDGRVLLANAIALARMGKDAKEILGKHILEILPPLLGQSRLARLREVVESGRPVEFEDERAGIHFRHSFYPALDGDGRVMFVVSFSRDITERKKTEALRQALIEQDRLRLGAAVEQASDAVIMFDLDGTIRYVNAAFESINRLPREQAVGRSYFSLFAGDPSAAAFRRAVDEGQAWHGPVIRPVPDGRTTDLEVMYSPAKDPAGRVIGGLATETDVTQKNALQHQVRQAQKMEALGTLAGGITHDFNNILGTIIINTELALLDMAPDDPAKRPLPVVLQAANRGKELVKQIITFSRQREWERQPLAIAPIIKDGMGLLRSTLPKDITVREAIDDASGVVLADPSHLHQILVNLCQNAALAMRDHGGDLEVTLKPVEVDEALTARHPDLPPGPYVRLTVADTGCGMTSEIVDRIFEPFFTTREYGQGSGLGLAVVLGIVKSYRGAILVRSKPGQGSVFEIYIPRLGAEALAAGNETPFTAALGRERILIVEDEEALRASLARGLERLGYRITVAADGRAALETFGKDPAAFDLVITDQTMPRMSGLELASELAAVRPDLPIILCTGFSEKVGGGTVGQKGIRELAMKPFTITEISRLIRKALGTGTGAPARPGVPGTPKKGTAKKGPL